MPPREFKLDCRRFRGEKPCEFGNACEACTHYQPATPRILIVKLDALGDVLRTTCVLRGLEKAYDDPHVTWIVSPAGVPLLNHNSRINVLLPYALPSIMRLQVERFDLALSLDKTPRATSVAMLAKAGEKRGFGLNEFGNVYPLSLGAKYAFQLGLDDELKFRRNTRTYQDVIYEVCGLKFGGEDYVYELSEEARGFQNKFAASHGLSGKPVVAVNGGGSAAFANKMWEAREIIEFVRVIKALSGPRVMLCGAHLEAEKIQTVVSACGEDVLHTGVDNTLEEFAALMGLADVVVTGDSLGMHFALAQGTKTVALFGPTCAQEIEMYGRGVRIIADVDCSPCYNGACRREPTCMETIRPERVAEEVVRLL